MSGETPTNGNDAQPTSSDLPTAARDAHARHAAGAIPFGEKPGDMIGPYKLMQVIGEGGFGTVWLAERREPIVQRVALKVIKPGMDSRAVIARFEQERQALAVMDHPNVAKVYDAGATPQGRPYFVMEHVQGEPITDFCDKHRYTIRQRLELFIPVCEAVQHAHHKGIIHRDIKPSNILVTIKDGNAIPKVIDFGVAKAISHTMTEKTIFTEMGQLIGTPEYMSPEQAEMGAMDIDTRTDVYSLGVVLYELLTGALPFDPKTLRAAGYAEIQRMIREDEPPKPSTRLTTLDEATGGKVAKARQEERSRLVSDLRRELDWIPLMAMRKDRGRRYATTHELAEDIRRYLNGKSLEAAPESISYRFNKLIERNRRWIVAGCVLVALGLASLAYLLQTDAGRLDRTNSDLQALAKLHLWRGFALGQLDSQLPQTLTSLDQALSDNGIREVIRFYRSCYDHRLLHDDSATPDLMPELRRERTQAEISRALSDEQILLALSGGDSPLRTFMAFSPENANGVSTNDARHIMGAWSEDDWTARLGTIRESVPHVEDRLVWSFRPKRWYQGRGDDGNSAITTYALPHDYSADLAIKDSAAAAGISLDSSRGLGPWMYSQLQRSLSVWDLARLQVAIEHDAYPSRAASHGYRQWSLVLWMALSTLLIAGATFYGNRPFWVAATVAIMIVSIATAFRTVWIAQVVLAGAPQSVAVGIAMLGFTLVLIGVVAMAWTRRSLWFTISALIAGLLCACWTLAFPWSQVSRAMFYMFN